MFEGAVFGELIFVEGSAGDGRLRVFFECGNDGELLICVALGVNDGVTHDFIGDRASARVDERLWGGFYELRLGCEVLEWVLGWFRWWVKISPVVGIEQDAGEKGVIKVGVCVGVGKEESG